MPTIAKNTICIWYDGGAEEAARFYAATFPDSRVDAVHRAPADYPSGKAGDVLTVMFTVMGIPCMGLNGGPAVQHNIATASSSVPAKPARLNGGPAVQHNIAFSFQVATVDQMETDRYWNAIVGNGGRENACGWCQDQWGVSWQITPVALTQAVAGSDPAAARRAFEAMMTMGKIDVAAIKAAVRG
jgi:2-polyprenyl-6-hydroxyphenyl methylase/3-demethylubiquinone-9 3-methyltransferase